MSTPSIDTTDTIMSSETGETLREPTRKEACLARQARTTAMITAYCESISQGSERLLGWAAQGFVQDSNEAMMDLSEVLTRTSDLGNLLSLASKLEVYHTKLQSLKDTRHSWPEGHGETQLSSPDTPYKTRQDAFDAAMTEFEAFEQDSMAKFLDVYSSERPGPTIAPKRGEGLSIEWKSLKDLCVVLLGPESELL